MSPVSDFGKSCTDLKVAASRPGVLTNGRGLALDRLLDGAIHGRPIDESDAGILADSGNGCLDDLCAAASQVRDQGRGKTVTFSPKVFIPLTRLCRDFCGYCTFRQDPSSAGAELFLTPEQILETARAGGQLGCTEALFTLGERPEQRYPEAQDWLRRRGYATTLQYLADMCKLVAEETSLLPHANPGTMARREMMALAPYNPSMGLMLESTSERLYAQGGPHQYAPQQAPPG